MRCLRLLFLVLVATISRDVVQAAPPTALDQLTEACARGTLDAGFQQACHAVIRESTRAHPLGAKLPDDFFTWLDETPRLRDDAMLAIAQIGTKVASNLQLLRAFDEQQVERYAPLAVAFAAAWSHGDDAEPRRYWVDGWLCAGRDVPEMTESFAFHLERERAMRFPLRNAPWPILAHLADSLVPIDERIWALERYTKRKTRALRGLFGAVPYTLDPKRNGEPCTLESYLRFGGPCTHNVQFADGVFDAFGIPSGWAGGPGHTYPYWFESAKRQLTIHRTNELGNRNGKIRDPMSRGHVWEDRLRLLVTALNHSVPKRRRAALAAWAYRRVPASHRARASAILPAAVRENPYCYEALSATADATQARHLSLVQGRLAWKSIASALSNRPYDLPPLLDRALPAIGATSPTFDDDLLVLKALERRWKKAKQAGLLSRIPLWRARCLAARGEHGESAKILRRVVAQNAPSDPSRFESAVTALVSGTASRLDALRELLPLASPSPRAGWTTLHRSRFVVVRKMVAALRELKRHDEAGQFWYDELAAARGPDAGIGDKPLLVGGKGGAPFAEVPEGKELIGLRVSTTAYNGRTVIGCVQGIYFQDGKEYLGARAGRKRSKHVDARATGGWRVAGMIAAGSDRFDGFQLVFVRRDDAGHRVRLGNWIGSRGEREVLVGDRNAVIRGIRGRAGDDVDCFGLVGTAD